MVAIECSVSDCAFTTDYVSEALAISLLTNHDLAMAPQNPTPTVADATPAITANRAPKLERPKVDVGVRAGGWNVFTRRWEVFRSGSGIYDASALSQLFKCAETELGDSLFNANSKTASETLSNCSPSCAPWRQFQSPLGCYVQSFSSHCKKVKSLSEPPQPKYVGKKKLFPIRLSTPVVLHLTALTRSSATSS